MLAQILQLAQPMLEVSKDIAANIPSEAVAAATPTAENGHYFTLGFVLANAMWIFFEKNM